jgi:hypothetical protein
VKYVLNKLEDPEAPRAQRQDALRAVAIMHTPGMIEPLLKQLETACSPAGDRDLCGNFADPLDCYRPDRRVPEAMLRVAAELERRGEKSPTILISFASAVGKDLNAFKTVAAAKAWWAANGSSAPLTPYPHSWCAERDPGH